jgi:hypothetical protein
VDSLTSFFTSILRPLLAPASRYLLAPERTLRTWHYEAAVVATVLVIVAIFTSPDLQSIAVYNDAFVQLLVIWLSALAVLGSFIHAKVGYRMAEALEAQEALPISCYEWSGRYWLFKEILWLVVFFLSGAYPAIAGAVLFILYPAWRKIHVEERKKVRGQEYTVHITG